jgi:hypothetical protein
MIIRKTLMAATAATLLSAPAWALPATALSNGAPSTTPVGPPSTTPNNLTNPGHLKQGANDQDNDGHHGNGATGKSGPHGKSHKCAPHRVAYVAAGTLAKEATLTKNADGTYSGEVTIKVKRFNHHAKVATETEKTYTLTNAHLVFAITDTNNDGSAGTDDLKVGDLVALIGKITTIAKKCDHSKFTPQVTIRQVVFHDPRS